MTTGIVLAVFAFLVVAQVIALPTWLLFSVSLALIALFVIYGKDRTNVRNN
jgi:hypothetical protein